MFNFATQPQSPFKVISDSFRLFGRTFSKVWYWQLLFMLPYFILRVLDVELIGITKSASGWMMLVILISFVGMLIGFLGYCFICSRMNRTVTQEDISAAATMRFAWSRFWYVIGGIVVMYAAWAILFSGSAMFAVSGAGVDPALDTRFAIGFLLGIILFVVLLFSIFPAIIYPPIALFEGMPVFRSLKYSFSLAWGCWWRSFFIVLIVMGIPIAIIFAITLPSITAEIQAGVTSPSLFVEVVHFVAGTIVGPLFISMALVLYRDLKLRKIQRKNKNLPLQADV